MAGSLLVELLGPLLDVARELAQVVVELALLRHSELADLPLRGPLVLADRHLDRGQRLVVLPRRRVQVLANLSISCLRFTRHLAGGLCVSRVKLARQGVHLLDHVGNTTSAFVELRSIASRATLPTTTRMRSSVTKLFWARCYSRFLCNTGCSPGC